MQQLLHDRRPATAHPHLCGIPLTKTPSKYIFRRICAKILNGLCALKRCEANHITCPDIRGAGSFEPLYSAIFTENIQAFRDPKKSGVQSILVDVQPLIALKTAA